MKAEYDESQWHWQVATNGSQNEEPEHGPLEATKEQHFSNPFLEDKEETVPKKEKGESKDHLGDVDLDNDKLSVWMKMTTVECINLDDDKLHVSLG